MINESTLAESLPDGYELIEDEHTPLLVGPGGWKVAWFTSCALQGEIVAAAWEHYLEVEEEVEEQTLRFTRPAYRVFERALEASVFSGEEREAMRRDFAYAMLIEALGDAEVIERQGRAFYSERIRCVLDGGLRTARAVSRKLRAVAR